jgi:dihydropyrimidinase
MLDLIVSGGIAVMPGGTTAVDIGVAGEKIVAIGAPGGLGSAGAAQRVVDATGQIVIPGGVDPHIHCLSPIPFPGRNEDMLSAPPDQVSRAALFGGTTTMLDFVDCPPETGLQQSIEARRREGSMLLTSRSLTSPGRRWRRSGRSTASLIRST